MSVIAVILCEKRGCVAGGALRPSPSGFGVLAQLVERLNGIEEVRGSNPLGSTIFPVSGNLESTGLRQSLGRVGLLVEV